MSLLEILLRTLFAGLIYPGFLFLAAIGMLAESLRRRFAARVEGREAPPWLQPWHDLRKLAGRTDYVPAGLVPPSGDEEGQRLAATRREGTRLGLYAMPVAGLVALSLGTVLLPLPGNLWPFLASGGRPLGADLLGCGLLFLGPALLATAAGSLGGSVYGQVAGSRSFQLLAVCALPYAAAVFGPALVRQTLNLNTAAAANSLPMLGVKALCGMLFLLCLPAILRLRPLAGGPGEALSGLTTDISGPALGLFLLMQWAERLALALFFALLYVPLAPLNPLLLVAGVLLALGVSGLVDVLFGQVRLRDAFDFYLRYANPAGLALLVILSLAVKA